MDTVRAGHGVPADGQNCLSGNQQDHTARQDGLMQLAGGGTKHSFGTVAFNGTTDCFRCDHAHRGIHHIFIPEID